MIEKEERKITVINDWIQNIHIYGHACQSNKNGNMNFAEYNDLNRHGGQRLRCHVAIQRCSKLDRGMSSVSKEPTKRNGTR